MERTAGITRVPFDVVKDNVSNFVTAVVRQHSPRILERGRANPEGMFAMSADDLLLGLASNRFDARVSNGTDGSVIARLPQFGLVVSGKDFESAIDALAAELTEYVDDFFSAFDFYRHTDRVEHLPFMLRFGLTAPEKRRDLLLEEPKDLKTPTISVRDLALVR